MAARLPVVISQALRREPAAIACEEKLITELLFTNGLDATLIGPIENVEVGSTDHLCLEGLKGPFALLSWTSIEDTRKQLSRMGVHGSIVNRDAVSLVSLPIDSTRNEDPDRRIDYYQLRADRVPKSWIDSLKEILEAREVKAFSIQVPGKPSPRPAVSPAASKPDELPGIAIVTAECTSRPSQVFAKTIDPNDEDEVWEHLDTLVDDLDRSDF